MSLSLCLSLKKKLVPAIINKSYVDSKFVFLQKMYNSYAHIIVPSFVITLFPVIVIDIKFIFSLMLLYPIFTHVPTRMIKLSESSTYVSPISPNPYTTPKKYYGIEGIVLTCHI